MMWILNIIHYVVPFIFLLGVLVFVHEFGHFLAARLSGVHVSAFSIGFGKELWERVDKSGTHWKISAIPLGGYCQFLGDADESSSTSDEAAKTLTEEEKKHAFFSQSPWKKLFIVLAGPGFNYLFAILIYTALFSLLGNFTLPPVVGDLIADGAAEQAGILKNDRILKINGREIQEFSEISREVAMAVDHQLELEIKRGDEILAMTVPLKEITQEQQDGRQVKQYMLGIKSVTTIEEGIHDVSLPKAFILAVSEVWEVTETTLRGVGQMIVGDRGGEDIGGIIRIAEMTGDISKSQSFLDFILFMALLSVNLGLINLFPIPVLDGGHVIFYTIEILAGRPLNEKVQGYLLKVGIALLLSLMVFATWNDITHLIDRWFAS